MEPNASIVIPEENGEILSYSSTQCPDKHQKYLAHVLVSTRSCRHLRRSASSL